MQKSIPLGKIAGISIYIHITWFLVFGLVTWTLASFYFPTQSPGWASSTYYYVAVITSLLFFASVLAHELAHSMVALSKSIGVERITLFVFGGLAQIEKDAEKPGDEFLISVVGPLSSLALSVFFGGIAILAEPMSEKIASAAWYLSAINLMLAIFNMAPGFPLDGGRVLRSILWWRTRNLRLSTQITAYIGQGLAYLLFAGGLFILFTGNVLSGAWFVFIGWFLHSASESNYRQVLIQEKLKELQVKEIMSTDFDMVNPNATISEFMTSTGIRSETKSAVVHDGESMLGIVSYDDILSLDPSTWETATIKQVMRRPEDLDTVNEEDNGSAALLALDRHGQSQLPVLNHGKLVGLLSRVILIQRLGIKT